jgi:hypothetical protein
MTEGGFWIGKREKGEGRRDEGERPGLGLKGGGV